MNTNSMNHQNSEREAVPLKSAYLLKHVRIDSAKVMSLPPQPRFGAEAILTASRGDRDCLGCR